MTTPNSSAFARLARKIAPESTLLRAWPLSGGVSAQVTAIELTYPSGHMTKLVVRQHGAADRARNPRIAADEFSLLRCLHAAGIAVPEPYGLDESGEIFSTPVVIIAYIEGTSGSPQLPGDSGIHQFAAQLAAIHALDPARLGISFLPQHADSAAENVREQPSWVDTRSEEGRAWEVLQSVWPFAPRNPLALLHGDYWPGNTLWKDGRLAAVIDWEDAAIGDPLADIANSRLEIFWAEGAEAMERFTRRYQVLANVDLANLPYWDLYATLRPARNMAAWGLDSHTEQRMREGLRLFIRQALARVTDA